jgi:hypothetical protein
VPDPSDLLYASTPPHPLLGIRAKLKRGDEHVRAYERRERGLFAGRNPPRIGIAVQIVHYPALRPANPQADRPIREALAALRADRGVIRSARIRDARAFFADDVVATILAREVGGLDAVPVFDAAVAEGTTAFIRFANLALDEHLVRAREGGAVVDEVEPTDPGDLRRGWKKQ